MPTKYKGTEQETAALNAYINLMRAAETLGSLTAANLRKYGLTVSQFGALEALFHLGPMNQRQLSGKILKSTGNLTTVIDNLEKRGLVKRTDNPADKRVYLVRLTDDGDRLIRRILPEHIRKITAIMNSNLTSDELETLRTLCRKLGKSAM